MGHHCGCFAAKGRKFQGCIKTISRLVKDNGHGSTIASPQSLRKAAQSRVCGFPTGGRSLARTYGEYFAQEVSMKKVLVAATVIAAASFAMAHAAWAEGNMRKVGIITIL